MLEKPASTRWFKSSRKAFLTVGRGRNGRRRRLPAQPSIPATRSTRSVCVGATQGQEYNFGELLPGSIAGRVHADQNGDGRFDAGEKLLAGVRCI
jgi:hypothetical protein